MAKYKNDQTRVNRRRGKKSEDRPHTQAMTKHAARKAAATIGYK